MGSGRVFRTVGRDPKPSRSWVFGGSCKVSEKRTILHLTMALNKNYVHYILKWLTDNMFLGEGMVLGGTRTKSGPKMYNIILCKFLKVQNNCFSLHPEHAISLLLFRRRFMLCFFILFFFYSKSTNWGKKSTREYTTPNHPLRTSLIQSVCENVVLCA